MLKVGVWSFNSYLQRYVYPLIKRKSTTLGGETYFCAYADIHMGKVIFEKDWAI